MIKYTDGFSFDDLMLVPKYSAIKSRAYTDLSVELSKGFKFNLPFVPSNMKTITELNMAKTIYNHKGLAIFHRFADFSQQLKWLEEIKSWGEDILKYVGFSVGVKEEHYKQIDHLVNSGVRIICLDIAHGNSKQGLDMTKYIADKYPDVLLISGNAATGDGAENIWKAGADICKVGVGGGCFAAGTRILMANGFYKNIEEIKPGEYVINKNGKAVKVINSFCTGEKQVAKLRNNLFYEDTFVTPDHQMWVEDLNNITTKITDIGYAKALDKVEKATGTSSKYKWKEVGNLKQDMLLVPNKIDFKLPETFEIVLNKSLDGNQKGFTHEADTILKPSYNLGYLFGTFLGDGCTLSTSFDGSDIGSVSWYYSKNEIDIVNKTMNCIRDIFPQYNVSYNENESIYNVQFYYKPLADYLYSWGKKSDKKLPEHLLVNDKEYLKGMLDGLIDSDRSIEKGKTIGYERIGFSNTSIYLIELFNILSIMINGSFPNNSKQKITTGGLKNCNIENCKQPYVARFSASVKTRLTKNYQVVENLGYELTENVVPVYDLEVDCDTHSFIANNMIVHNSICLTRINTANGVPSMTSLSDCYDTKTEIEKKLNKKLFIMNDGGCKSSGDVVKALCFADLCMIGNLFAGSSDTPGEIINSQDGKHYKSYVGSSTHRGSYSEGVEALVTYKGDTSSVIRNISEGIRSGMSYQNATNLIELKKDPYFSKITSSGLKESQAHDVIVLK